MLLLACAVPDDSAADSKPDATTTPCAEPAGQLEALGSGFEGGTEGVAFQEGVLHVSGADAIWAWQGGSWSRVAEVHALGLAPGPGGLYAADPGDFSLDGSGDDGRLLQLGAELAVLGSGMPNPNFVLPTDDGVLVSDDTAAIYRVDDGMVQTWSSEIPSPNGMGLDPSGEAVYVVSTFVSDPPLWRIGSDGTGAEEITRFPTGSAPDGLAVDGEGQVWVALNLEGAIVRIDPASGAETARFSGPTTPASLAFGRGEVDPCSLVVTELYGETVWRLSVGVEG